VTEGACWADSKIIDSDQCVECAAGSYFQTATNSCKTEAVCNTESKVFDNDNQCVSCWDANSTYFQVSTNSCITQAVCYGAFQVTEDTNHKCLACSVFSPSSPYF
jgi:hypothetical protein